MQFLNKDVWKEPLIGVYFLLIGVRRRPKSCLRVMHVLFVNVVAVMVQCLSDMFCRISEGM